MSKGATVSKTEVPAYQEQAFKDLYAAGRQVAGMPFVPYLRTYGGWFFTRSITGF